MYFPYKNVTCQPLSYAGVITMQAQGTAPVQVDLVDGVLQGTTFAESFTFQQCTSTFMSQPPSTNPDVTYYYG